MPTNVTPQYRKVESQFREATTTQQKIAALQEMLSIMPKHKGTDHLRAQHRTRLSKLMAELEGPTPGGSGGGPNRFRCRKKAADGPRSSGRPTRENR